MADGSAPVSYDDPAPAGETPAVSLLERALICDLFDRVGPAAPTLSGAWDTHHLAAHLAVRERSPVSSLKSAIPHLSDSDIEGMVAEGDFAGLVGRLRSGPPRLSFFGAARADQSLNTLEFFVHHEDVRRATPGWSRRLLPGWAEDQIWARVRVFSKLIMRASPVPVALRRSDDPDAPPATAAKGPHPVTVQGLPSEVALFVYGRSAVAGVEMRGSDAAVDRLRGARFSL